MKNLINKVRHHGKKITIYLKSQPKWVVRCMFWIWAILGLVLSLHTHPIGWTNAQSIECPEGQDWATWDVCITNEKDIVIQATATESGQIVTINKYFANDYTVDRWDGTTGEWATWGWIIENIISHTTHTYSATWTYNITLSLSWADRWTFREMWWEISYTEPLVPVSWTTVTDVQIIYMPSLTGWFWDSAEVPGDRFFSWFNNNWAITSLPEWSFNTSQITTVGDLFFFCFNCNWKLTSLPEWSFNTSKISGSVGHSFFSHFNYSWNLVGLPIWSFNTSQITTAWNLFFYEFNRNWKLTSLPEWSFNTSKISGSVGHSFFSHFNANWQLISLPANSFDTSNITSAGDSFFVAFNNNWALTSLPEWSFNISQITTAWDLFFTMFNSRWALTSLPVESFDTSNITSAWFDFFQAFNYNWKLTSLPEWSFNTSKITSVWDFFFGEFNTNWALTSLPEWSFNISNITTVWDRFFSYFNSNWALTSLPDSFKLNSVWSQSVSWYQNAFNSSFTLNKNVSDLVSWVTAPLDDRNVFSDNQPWRCGVDTSWLDNIEGACSITYKPNWGSEIVNPKKKYEANTTWVVAWDGIETPTRTGYAFSGWYTAEQWWDLVDIVVFPNMNGGTLYAQWIDNIKPTCNVAYEFQLISWNHSTLAKLVNCSESWNVINNSGSTEYRFLSSGNFKFEFQDLAGNTWSAEAIVSYVKNSGDIISLYNANKALSCRHYYKSWNSSQDYKLYVTTWTMYLYLNTSIEGTGIDSHILLTDDKLYQWWSSYSQYFGSWEWMYQIYKFNMENELASFFNDEDFYFICYPWINDMSIFNVPSNVTFRTQGHYSANNGTFFSVSIDDTIKAWENTNFVVKIMKDWATFKGYTGTVYFELTDRNWNIVDRDLYEFSEGRHYKFDESDRWRKTFSVKIKKEWAYVLKLYDSDNEYIEWSEIITVKSNGSSSSFEYDTYKFNPKYSDEMNKAYQYARYYNITTIDSIKDAGMGTWLNRIAMAKMLSQYAVNALWINNFNTSRNCTFKDVSSSLDRQYDYWVTRACQLWIMWINTPDNKFYPNWYVSRAEFATALSRLLFNTKDWLDKYYSTHISKLYKEWIIKNTDPKLREKRWYVMLMLMRASENFDD